MCVCTRVLHCFGLSTFLKFAKKTRLGPSASQLMGVDDDKISEVVKAMSLLQSVMREPWAQQLLNNVSPATEVDKARSGAPTSARPASTSARPDMTPAPAEPDLAEKVASEPAKPAEKRVAPPKASPEANGEASEPTPAEEPMINSSTCRAAHPRLSRRMVSMSATEVPNMHKLWSGGRKDW